MHKNTSPNADKSPQTSPEAPFTTFIQLDGRSPVPSQFRTPGTFTITRLQSPAGLPDRITKLSPVPALLVSIFLKSLPSSSYQVWTSYVPAYPFNHAQSERRGHCNADGTATQLRKGSFGALHTGDTRVETSGPSPGT